MNTNTIEKTSPKKPRPMPAPRNGIDTPTLLTTVGVVRDQPALAQFTFRASSRWAGGTHSVIRVDAFDGAGATHVHAFERSFDADHPAVLVGGDQGPTPVEFLLMGLAGCITAGIANIAAARGVTLESVESTVEGDIDLQGLLGISKEVRNGYQGIHATFRIRGHAPADQLREIVERSRALSAVFDVLTNGVPVEIDIDAA